MRNHIFSRHLEGKYREDPETGCWIWSGTKCSQGRYGKVNGFKKTTMAHRLSYTAFFGEIGEGLYICHACDNGLCINPDHLFAGTAKDNMQDCLKKGRYKTLFKNQSGENNANAHPGMRQRNIDIRKDRSRGLTYSQLKEKYGLKSNGHLRNILIGS